MKIRNEEGVALILTMFLLMALSAISASLMFLSQTEVSSSVNYRLMSQARYGAESGIQSGVNHLLYTYAPPTTAGGDPIGAYDTTVSPVTFNGQPVVLSANATVASNYPVAAVQNAFSAAVQGTLAAGTQTTVAYAPYATLLSMRQIVVYGGGLQTIQTWQVTSTGTITTGTRAAQVEVSAVLESQSAPADVYGAFGTAGTCGALKFAGGASVDSYDSSTVMGGVAPVPDLTGGNVGTNGNLTESGGATINGTLSTPRVGVGNCSNGNVDALTSSGGATVAGGVVQLPQAVNLPTPAVPNPLPPTGNVTINANTIYAPGSYADLKVTGGSELHLTAGTYNINSLSLQGGSKLVLDSGPVIINLAGVDQTDVISFTGGSEIINTTYDASLLQIQYAGTGNVKLAGGASFSAMVYAPNAAASFSGGGSFYGSVVASTVTDTGGAQIHFDRNLIGKFFTAGNAMMSAFTWKKY